MARTLKKYETELLVDGNQSEFAHLVLEFHEGICKEAGFTFEKACNYRPYTDFVDGIFTLYGDNGVKYFFDTEMNFRGTKF